MSSYADVKIDTRMIDRVVSRAAAVVRGVAERGKFHAQVLVHIDSGFLHDHIDTAVVGPLAVDLRALAPYALDIELRFPYLVPGAQRAVEELDEIVRGQAF